ncbi:MAG: hypothetical protein ABIP30_14940 [Ferruginibacter sp.]
MLDSIKRSADSIYAKEYFTRDFAEAIYFKNTKDTTLTQVMKDKDSIVRQVIITKNKKRLFYAQYYGNGQLIAKYNLDDFGQYDGYSEEYYQNGEVRSSGFYSNGFYIGKWKNTDSLGNYISTDEYNNDGRKIRSSVE